MIDFHNHLLPAVDDGAATLAETRAALEAFRAQGVRTLVITPHLMASLLLQPEELAEYRAAVDAAWESVTTMARTEFPELRLERGFEVMLDVPAPALGDPAVRLAGSKFALVEFAYMQVPPDPARALFDVQMGGVVPIIAHPERYAGFADRAAFLTAATEWKRLGALLQVNHASLLGRYGAEPRTRAWTLLENGLADYLCSDYHARGTLHVTESVEAVRDAGGAEQAELLVGTNPQRMLEGQHPLPVPPLALNRPSVWRRMFGSGGKGSAG